MSCDGVGEPRAGDGPMYEIAKYFLEFVKELMGLKSSVEKADLEKRTRLAQYLENISTSLNAIGAAFAKKEEPDAQCGELDEYVRSLRHVCGGILADSEISRFEGLLQGRANGRAVMFISDDAVARKTEAQLMAKAAGQLKALANSLKV
jgi:hypothetical protein